MAVATLLKVGSTGLEVELVQSRLRTLGFDSGPVDGIFGTRTEQGVRAFQQARGLVVDGVVGVETFDALELDLGLDGNGDGEARGGLSTLVELGLVAERNFGLTVGECSAPGAPSRWGPVHAGHSERSFHLHGRAFDASGPVAAMNAFAAFVDERLSAITELIHNPNGSINDGRRVGPTFWGEQTWAGHVGHVHVAI
jgi:peptidoglycan hydrolase-like protein with peptidoglycan-binding domain